MFKAHAQKLDERYLYHYVPVIPFQQLNRIMSYQALLREFDLRPKHSLGQVFLTDDRVIERIVALLGLTRGDRVVELGAGPGFITKRIAEESGDVYAVEIDPRFRPLHETLFASLDPKPRVVYEDARHVDFDALAATPAGRLIVFGNLPYYLTTELVLLAVSQMPSMARALFMIQEDVVERLMNRPGTKKYGTLSIVTNLFGIWRVENTVPRRSFTPSPHVTSSLVSLIPSSDESDKQVAADPGFHRFITSLFQFRRKTLMNALKLAFTPENMGAELFSFLEQHACDPGIRAEQLTPVQFKDLYLTLRTGGSVHKPGNPVS